MNDPRPLTSPMENQSSGKNLHTHRFYSPRNLPPQTVEATRSPTENLCTPLSNSITVLAKSQPRAAPAPNISLS